jgi:phosphohistidine phosphatase
MKSVLTLRHAKSSWKHPELIDHDRPLNKRDAARI